MSLTPAAIAKLIREQTTALNSTLMYAARLDIDVELEIDEDEESGAVTIRLDGIRKVSNL